MTYEEAKNEAEKRWGKGKHIFCLNLMHSVGPNHGQFVIDHWDDFANGIELPAEPAAWGMSWEEAFADYDRHYPQGQ